jgi:hypothetical protein
MNKLKQVIEAKETAAFKFKPNNLFFKDLGIGKKRFYAFLKNEMQPNLDEVERIAKVLNVAAEDLIQFKTCKQQ